MTTRNDLGDVTVHRIVEDVAPFVDFLTFFPDFSAAQLEQHADWLSTRGYDRGSGKIVVTFQSYLVVTPHHRILIDTCVGNHKERPARPMWHKLTSERYMRNLAAAGYRVEDIDIVCCTHLHGDHVGWNTKLDNGRWVPTFPNARYIFTDTELAYWTERARDKPDLCPWVVDSVLPIVAARRSDVVKHDHRIDDHVAFEPTPGHTIDHVSVWVGRGDATAFVTGDMVHSPLQMKFPELGMMSDFNRAQGGRTRRHVFERLAETPTLCCTAHFPEPSIGHVTRDGDAFGFKTLGA
jgi:glyoxylase-like metal-dependent hydrolase (beta-lactamase superfamily II)